MSQPQAVPTKQFLNQKEVCQISTLSRSTLERLERSGEMPRPRRFGARCKRYPAQAIHEWLAGTWRPEGKEVSHV